MNVAAIQNAVTATTLPPGPAAAQGPASGQKVFLELINRQLENVNQQQQVADQMVEQLVTGQTDNVHDVVVNMAKADLMFKMVLEIRNRLIDSYQEVMRMQM